MGQQLFEALDHIQIPVLDVEESIQWYIKHLGFYLHGRPNHEDMAFLCIEREKDLMSDLYFYFGKRMMIRT